MSLLQIVFIGIGLAMDAFAVSVTSGVAITHMRVRHAMLIGGFFGAFQAIMPLLGWLAGHWAKNVIQNYDHWIAFVILSLIGGKMIWETRIQKEAEEVTDPLNISILFLLAIATSIDALAVGVTFSFLDVSILQPVLLIGAITFALTFIGTYIGKLFGHLFEDKLEILGGVILIGIGTKILIEHLCE
mgnify:CR=1 FL=1